MNCLVTSSIPETYDNSCENILLEHCCLGDEDINKFTCVAEKYANEFAAGSKQSLRRHDESQRISERLANELGQELNTILNLSSEKKYWDMVLGHFLRRYVSALAYRKDLLSIALDRFEITHSYAIRCEHDYELVVPDNVSFCLETLNSVWNNKLNAKILQFISQVKIIEIPPQISGYNEKTEKPSNKNKLLKNVLNAFTSFFQRDSDSVIAATYLPKIVEIFLNLYLCQMPQNHRWPEVISPPPNQRMRQKLKMNLSEGSTSLEKLAKKLLPEVLPTCFLENHLTIREFTERLKLPKNPEVIFVSNLFENNETFKVWVADQCSRNTPLIIGQHGAGYGTHKFLQTKAFPEVKHSDLFLSWGETPVGYKSVPLYVLTNAWRANKAFNRNGGLIILPPGRPLKCHVWDAEREFLISIQTQRIFLANLCKEIQKKTTIRLAPNTIPEEKIEKNHWACDFPDVGVQKSNLNFHKAVTKFKLSVFFYDSTGFLELLSRNIPVICVLPSGLSHLNEDAEKEYKALLKANLIFLDAKKAALFISAAWSHLPSWWFSTRTQNAKSRFCQKFAKETSRPISQLSHVLRRSKSHD